MIKYSLSCENEHEFEGWFSDSDEFDRLAKTGHLDCPVCGNAKIEKLLMAPSLKKKTNAGVALPTKEDLAAQAPTASVPAPSNTTAVSVPELPPQLADVHAEMVEKVREFKKHVVENTEDVGKNFVEEARKIHFGESEKRGIHGQADVEEAMELIEEGIDVMPIPDLPEDKN